MKTRHFILVGLAAAGSFATWLAPAYLESRDLGTSRLLAGWNDARFAAFHRLYFAIEIGMTREQIEETIHRVYPEDGARSRPKVVEDTPQRLVLFLDPEGQREPNCEGIFIRLAEGEVVGKGYVMD